MIVKHKNYFHDGETAFKNSQIKLQKDLAMTSKKNTVSHSKDSSLSHTKSNKSSLFSLKNLSPQQRLMVAESELKIAQVKVDLARKLAVNKIKNHHKLVNSNIDNDEMFTSNAAHVDNVKKADI